MYIINLFGPGNDSVNYLYYNPHLMEEKIDSEKIS